MSATIIFSDIDFDRNGKQIDWLNLPHSVNRSAYGVISIPIAVVKNGDGPTVLLMAGNHGDEYEGQVAAMRLLQELQPDQVTGRVIVIPVLSPSASKGNTRNWPSGANFNRSFPGRPDGPPHEQLADYLTRVLFPMADVVIDMHSGGRSAYFLPCSHMHVVDNPAQRKAMLEAMEAWCSDHHYLYIDINGNGLLPVEAENQGKLVITTELGGGGRTPAPVHRLAWDGLNNVLRHVGVQKGQVQTRAGMGLPPAVIIDGRDARNIVVSPEDGMFEAMLEPGDPVVAGQPVGRLWFMDRPDRPAELLRSPTDGFVVVTKAIPITEQGDCVFVVGTPIDRASLL